MKPARILLLLVAIVAGSLAAYLATRGKAPVQKIVTTTQVREEAKRQVLIANANIGVGQRLSSSVVSWQDWPEGAVRPEYITSDVIPDAPDQMEGTVARFEIFAGEPIREAKLVRADQGYLSAVILPGMRAVSVSVTAESGAGGYIVPNDRVDVVRTKRSSAGTGTQVILSNVKVLAIGNRLGETGATAGNPDTEDPQAQVFGGDTIATLELSPGQAETIIGAAAEGQLTLVLRSVADFTPTPGDSLMQTSNQPIRLIRFGVEKNVLPGASQEAAAPVLSDPAQAQQAAIFADNVDPYPGPGDPAQFDPASPDFMPGADAALPPEYDAPQIPLS